MPLEIANFHKIDSIFRLIGPIIGVNGKLFRFETTVEKSDTEYFSYTQSSVISSPPVLRVPSSAQSKPVFFSFLFPVNKRQKNIVKYNYKVEKTDAHAIQERRKKSQKGKIVV